jgi:hypothetical protein
VKHHACTPHVAHAAVALARRWQVRQECFQTASVQTGTSNTRADCIAAVVCYPWCIHMRRWRDPLDGGKSGRSTDAGAHPSWLSWMKGTTPLQHGAAGDAREGAFISSCQSMRVQAGFTGIGFVFLGDNTSMCVQAGVQLKKEKKQERGAPADAHSGHQRW